ncbi:MAG TPA: IS1 family transposase [Candidatus Acidoferrales bacterium]|nr:IS1 family transposase [Candidatus Acidoferrales bacterium]
MTGISKDAILKLLHDIGVACADYQDATLRNLPCKHLQVDEIWSFCYAKEKNVPQELKGKSGYGDVWTWVAIDAETKLVPCWRVGARDAWNAQHFMYDVAARMANRIQLTTDGLRVYLMAVELAFGTEIDFAMLVKMYSKDRPRKDVRYSPADYLGCKEIRVEGNPNPRHISTSFAERQNLTMRMKMRRFTRLTNAFSKKVENHAAAIALHYMHYNFCRIHQTLRVTPAMEAGVTDHVWSLDEVVGLLEHEERRLAA